MLLCGLCLCALISKVGKEEQNERDSLGGGENNASRTSEYKYGRAERRSSQVSISRWDGHIGK